MSISMSVTGGELTGEDLPDEEWVSFKATKWQQLLKAEIWKKGTKSGAT